MATILPSRAFPATPWAARRAGDDYGAHDEPDWRGIDWREHRNDVLIEGRRVHYVDMGAGAGPPIVLVHGLAGNWQNWIENLPCLARERRVLALDLPGFGQSERPAGRITMEGYGRTVDAFAEALDLGEISLVGNSMGGFVAAETAIQAPGRVERLVLISAAGITTNTLRREPVMVWGRVAMMAGARGAAEKRMAVARPRLRHAVYSTIMRHPSRLAPETLWEISEGAGRSAFRWALEAILDYDYRERLGEIRAPTLVVWGENDMLVPVKDADEYERLIPGARKVVLADTGHMAMVERPPTFNRMLLEFLGEPRGGEQTAAVGEPT
ncbi:MAG TPA: alpha/beta fold hydrolase, partial [Thermoleophilaceae bacterium]|nr:alpha/beta fold hydrolase [Thermoleophilaceae bacterium]